MPVSKSVKITPPKKLTSEPTRLSTKTKPKAVVATSKPKKQDKPRNVEPKKLKRANPIKDNATKPNPTKLEKPKKAKVIRDSFTMPKQEFDKIADLKKQCLAFGISIKKSELLRAGLQALNGFTPQQLKAAVSQVEKIKTGRPS